MANMNLGEVVLHCVKVRTGYGSQFRVIRDPTPPSPTPSPQYLKAKMVSANSTDHSVY